MRAGGCSPPSSSQAAASWASTSRATPPRSRGRDVRGRALAARRLRRGGTAVPDGRAAAPDRIHRLPGDQRGQPNRGARRGARRGRLRAAGGGRARRRRPDRGARPVDPSERTSLVTGGPFALVRNPIYTAMIPFFAGIALIVANVVGLAAAACVVVSLELQTRAVEEPHLLRAHGDEYASYAARVGRFVPGVGRL